MMSANEEKLENKQANHACNDSHEGKGEVVSQFMLNKSHFAFGI